MDQKIIKNIFKKYNLGAVKSVKKIDIGFTNKVYSINNKFILKVCADENNEENFKKTEISSIDFVLDIIKRMVEYPKKYMSEKSEKFAKKEDYAQLLDWFCEFYSGLFNFKNLDKRLDLYSIEYNLENLILYPNAKEIKQTIAKIIKFEKYF